MSPSIRGASSGPLGPVGGRAGNDSTLVGLSMPRQLLLRVRIPALSVSMTASLESPTALFAPTLAIAAAVAMARWMTASASGSVCQQSATTRTSVMGRADSAIGPESLLRGELAPGTLAAGLRIKACWLPAAAAILHKRQRYAPPVRGGSRLRP